MNLNEPVAWRTHYPSGWEYKDGNPPFELKGNSQLLYINPVNPYKAITNTKIEPVVVSYTNPVKEQGNPVAWRSQDPDGYWSIYQAPVEGAEPLYTGFKELTDDEIWDFINAFCLDMGDYWELTEKNAIPMIRAILRKAQEK